MKAWLLAHLRAFSDAWRRLAAQPLAAGLSVLVIGIALTLPLALAQMLVQTQRFAERFTGSPQVSLFLAMDVAADQRQALETALRAHPGAKSVRFVGRDAALADLAKSAGLGDVAQALPANPLPDAFVVDVRGTSAATLEQLRRDAAALPGVEHVQSDHEWARRLDALVSLARSAVLAVAVLLAAGLVAITFNTIRLQILGRRAEIELAQLIGATDGFVRRPFVYFGLLQGLLGALVAWILVAAIAAALDRELAVLNRLYGSALHFGLPAPLTVAGLSGLCALLGALGAALSVQDYLRRGLSK
ncbi:MAG: ABC transporter permease [Burkholderiales bacterium]|nr:ABC transporter permease [Burkholderiales bacterium]